VVGFRHASFGSTGVLNSSKFPGPQDIDLQSTDSELHFSCQDVNFHKSLGMICISQIFGDIQDFTSITDIVSRLSDSSSTKYSGAQKRRLGSLLQAFVCKSQTEKNGLFSMERYFFSPAHPTVVGRRSSLIMNAACCRVAATFARKASYRLLGEVTRPAKLAGQLRCAALSPSLKRVGRWRGVHV